MKDIKLELNKKLNKFMSCATSFVGSKKTKVLNLSNSHKIVLVIVVSIFLWMSTGIFSSKPKLDDQKHDEISVKIINSIAVNKDRFIKLNGVTQASKIIDIRAETEGAIEELFISDGQRVVKGQQIAQIDVKNREKQLEESNAEYDRQLLSYNATNATYKKKLSSEIALADANIRLKTAENNMQVAKDELLKTKPEAPSDGFIDSVYVEVGDYVTPSQNNRIATFISTDPTIVVAYIPERNIREAQDSSFAKIALSDNDIMIGDVTFLSRIAEPSTRTFKMEVHISNPSFIINSGETVKVLLPLKQISSHHIPKSTLTLDLKGKISIKTVTDENIVKDYGVEIIEEDEAGFWVTGLPDEVKIITLGQQYVKEGEAVNVNDKEA